MCLVGADPTDRDVDRHLPQLTTAWGEAVADADHPRAAPSRGRHVLPLTRLRRVGLRPRERRARVPHAPGAVPLPRSSTRRREPASASASPACCSTGSTRSSSRPRSTPASSPRPGTTCEQLAARPSAQHVDVRVLAIGDPADRGLARRQLDERLALLPTIGHVPRLGGGVANRGAIADAGSTTRSGRSFAGSSTGKPARLGPRCSALVARRDARRRRTSRTGSTARPSTAVAHFTARKHRRPPPR